MSREVTFIVNFGGKFETLEESGIVVYIGGHRGEVESEARALWQTLERSIPVPMAEQRVWYKLPYEENTELKILWNGGDSFHKLCEICNWIGVIELYLESDGSSGSGQGNEEEAEVPPVAVPPVANPTNTQNQFQEDARVEAVIAGINEDSEDERLPTTPQLSDNEEDPNQYERFEDSGELKIRQVFTCLEEFKKGLLDYALKGGWNIKYARWGPKRSEAVCAIRGNQRCDWRIYCSYDEGIDAYLVKRFNDKHTCIKDGRCSLLTDNEIAKLFVNDVRNNPSIKPKEIQEKIEEKYNIICTYDQLKKALAIIQAEYDEQYSKIKDYAIEIRK